MNYVSGPPLNFSPKKAHSALVSENLQRRSISTRDSV